MSAYPANCKDCDTPLMGRFCHACGCDHENKTDKIASLQSEIPTKPIPRIVDLIEDLVDNVWSFTRQMPATAWAMVAQPKKLLAGLHDGDRDTFLSPLKLYITATTLFFVFLSASQTSLAQFELKRDPSAPIEIREVGEDIILTGVRLDEKLLYPRSTFTSDALVVNAIDAALPNIKDPTYNGFLSFYRQVAADPTSLNNAITTWIPRLLWLLMPLYGLLLWPVFAGKSLYRHLIFALWVHAVFFMTLSMGALWNRTGLVGPWLNGLTLALGLAQLYAVIGAKNHFSVSWLGAIFKIGLISIFYIGLIWMPLIAGFFFWQITPADVRADLLK